MLSCVLSSLDPSSSLYSPTKESSTGTERPWRNKCTKNHHNPHHFMSMLLSWTRLHFVKASEAVVIMWWWLVHCSPCTNHTVIETTCTYGAVCHAWWTCRVSSFTWRYWIQLLWLWWTPTLVLQACCFGHVSPLLPAFAFTSPTHSAPSYHRLGYHGHIIGHGTEDRCHST